MSIRIQRLSELILQEIGSVVSNQLEDQRIGFVTFSEIKISADLSHAKVYVSVFGSKKEQNDSVIAPKSQ